MSGTTQPYQSLGARSHDTIWKVLPYVGVGSIILAISCAVAILAIGFVSDGGPQDSWAVLGYDVQPSVLLSLFATLGNALIRVAFTQGFAIAWWLQAHSGVSIGKLTAMFEHAYTFRSLFRLSNWSRITTASLVMLLLLADGPFLQRASTIRRESRTEIRNITVPVSSSPLLSGSTGVITIHDGDEASIYTPEFAQIIKQYNTRENYSIPGLQLPGTTKMTLVAPGWDIRCQNGSSPYRLPSIEEYVYQEKNRSRQVPAMQQTMFQTNITQHYFGNGYQMQVYTSYKSTPGGNGTKLWRACNLSEAIVRYPIRIENGAISLQPMALSENRTEQLIMRSYELASWGDYPSTLGGFWLALSQQFTTTANLTLAPGTGKSEYSITTDNVIASQYIDQNVDLFGLQTAAVIWTDPIDDIVAMANELSVRTAIRMTNFSAHFGSFADGYMERPTNTQPDIFFPNLTSVNRTISQSITAFTTVSGNFYHTSIGWLVGGVAIILLNCMLVMPTYWGWWRLERYFTMNPLDTAKAFDAPVLRDADPVTRPTAWVEPIQEMRVCYGRGLVEPEAGGSLETLYHRGKSMQSPYYEPDDLAPHKDGDEQSAHLSLSDNVPRRHVPKFRKIQ